MRRVLEFIRAIAGNPAAQLSIAGHYYLLTKENRRNFDRAIYWAKQAGRRGLPEGYMLAARAILLRDQSEDAKREAFAAYKAAADAGSAEGQQSVGWCYQQGFGVVRSVEREWHWLKLAAASGSRDSQLELARRFAEGDGTPVDEARAEFYFELARQPGRGQ